MNFRELYKADKQRYAKEKGHGLRFIRFFRKAQCRCGLSRLFYRFLLRQMRLRYGLEIPWNTKIGKGLYLGHPFNITINRNSEIGEWCNIHKGVTIGQQNRGKLKGTPKIGNHVWIGVNATVVGKIVIGDDVLIAPNSFVNCDVPSHSVVLGNPCQIHYKENATYAYIENCE